MYAGDAGRIASAAVLHGVIVPMNVMKAPLNGAHDVQYSVIYSRDKKAVQAHFALTGGYKERFMIRFRTLLCAASAAFGLTLGYTASAATLTVDIPACASYTLSGNTITCNTGSPGAPSCSISGASTGTVGTPVTLNGTCGTDTALAWTGCAPSGSSCSVSSSQAGPVVVSLNGGSAGTSGAQKTVTFSDPGQEPPPPVGVPVTCSDGTATKLAGTINAFDGVAVGLDSFNAGQTAYFVVNAPAALAGSYVQLAWLSIGGQSDQVIRQVYMSTTSPCDTSNPATTGFQANGSVYGYVNDGQPPITGSARRVNFLFHAQTGSTLFISFKNLKADDTTNSCTRGPCPIYIKPAILH
jgi:hypothetical protein